MATPSYWTAWGGAKNWKDNAPQLATAANSFTPFAPPPIPSGYYDPNLDAQRDAASRGLLDTQEDVGTQERRGGEDYNTNVAALTKHYTDLGTAQGEQANAYGVVPGGGALLQAAAKRAANQATDQGNLDSTYNRSIADLGNTLTRAQREDVFYGQDVGAQKNFQAQQAGYAAPTGPSNEYTSPSGQSYRVVRRNGFDYRYDPSGKLIGKPTKAKK